MVCQWVIKSDLFTPNTSLQWIHLKLLYYNSQKFVKTFIKIVKKFINPISTLGIGGRGIIIPHPNFLKNFKKYKLVLPVSLWLWIYIYLTYSEKFSGFHSCRKSGSGYFLESTWKFSEIYNFVQISYFLYSCCTVVFWWKDYFWW